MTTDTASAEALLADARDAVRRALDEVDPRCRPAVDAIDEALAILRGDETASARAAADAGRIGFLSTVCHDLKDPLAAVVMGSSFLLRDGRHEDQARVQRMAQAIHRAGTRMGTLLQNLTDFVHLTTGRRRFDLQDVPLDPIVHRVLTPLREQATTANVTLSYSPSSLTARCDAEAILLALHHLVSNGLRYSPPTSTLTITATRTSSAVQLHVADQGSGVPEARLPHLFDTYWNSRQKARDGVGLGLGIVSAIASSHGHPPAVRTSPTGTTITLTLPLPASA